MELRETGIRRFSSTSQIQTPEQMPSRFIDRFIRLKTTYWNRGFAIVLLTFIGLTILQLEYLSLFLSLRESYEENYSPYCGYGMLIGFIPGGVLATVYPAHKLAWFILWLYVVNRDRSQSLFRPCRDSNNVPRSSGISIISLKRSIILDIPWKSFCTSLPVIALVISYICNTNAIYIQESYFAKSIKSSDQPLRNHSSIMLLPIFVVLELFPEITVCISVTNVRKLLSCSICIAMGVEFLLEAFKVNTFLLLDKNELFKFIYSEMKYFHIFGIGLNHLDIAPKYASIIFGFQSTIFHISRIYLFDISEILLIADGRDDFRIHILMAVIYIPVAVFYAIFGSAEIQPWGEDKTIKDNQQNMHDEVILPAV